MTNSYLDRNIFVDSVFGNRQHDIHHMKNARCWSDFERPIEAFVELREACVNKILRDRSKRGKHMNDVLNCKVSRRVLNVYILYFKSHVL